MLEDPTAPMSPTVKTWEVSACSAEEIVKSYGAVATLAMKITRVAVQHRQEAASACWHALQCINHIYARLATSWTACGSNDRFVVIHIKDSQELDATGRIVIGPRCLLFQERDVREHGEQRRSVGEVILPARRPSRHSSRSDGPESRTTLGAWTIRSALCRLTRVSDVAVTTGTGRWQRYSKARMRSETAATEIGFFFSDVEIVG